MLELNICESYEFEKRKPFILLYLVLYEKLLIFYSLNPMSLSIGIFPQF